ncbi:hypothetical protein Tco_1312894 [Tanacetum coccineum]
MLFFSTSVATYSFTVYSPSQPKWVQEGTALEQIGVFCDLVWLRFAHLAGDCVGGESGGRRLCGGRGAVSTFVGGCCSMEGGEGFVGLAGRGGDRWGAGRGSCVGFACVEWGGVGGVEGVVRRGVERRGGSVAEDGADVEYYVFIAMGVLGFLAGREEGGRRGGEEVGVVSVQVVVWMADGGGGFLSRVGVWGLARNNVGG